MYVYMIILFYPKGIRKPRLEEKQRFVCADWELAHPGVSVRLLGEGSDEERFCKQQRSEIYATFPQRAAMQEFEGQ